MHNCEQNPPGRRGYIKLSAVYRHRNHIFQQTHTNLEPSRGLRPRSYYKSQTSLGLHLGLKGMTYDRHNRPILSAKKIGQQKSLVCHAKIRRLCRPI